MKMATVIAGDVGVRPRGAQWGELARLLRWVILAIGCLMGLGSSVAAHAQGVSAAAPAAQPQVAAVPAQSADASAVGGGAFLSEVTAPSSQLRLMVNKSVVIATKTPYKRVSVGQPEIADVNLLGPGNLLLTGKKPGNTQLMVWDDSEKLQVINVSVQIDLAGLSDQLRALFPNLRIDAQAINGEVVLKGNVPSVNDAEQIALVAAPYAPKVLNFLVVSGGQQVMIAVRFAEVSRGAMLNLGFSGFGSDGKTKFGTQLGPGSDKFGSVASGKDATINSAVTLFGGGAAGNAAFEYFVTAMQQNNLLRILAEPNITVESGQEANFLAGGSIPIPVSQGGSASAITIDFREYGVKLKVVPVILGDGRIRLKVSPEVSDLDYANGVTLNGFVIPGITQRKVSTTVELREGQSFALAGLLNTSVSATKNVTPLLGELPVIGPIFRTVQFSRKETELVVLVTPHIVEPLNPADLPRLPGEKWRYPSENELFLKAYMGGPDNSAAAPAAQPGGAPGEKGKPAPRFYGQYGFVPVAQSTVPPAPRGKD